MSSEHDTAKKDREFSLGAVALIVTLVLANLWLVGRAFSPPRDDLPKLNVGILETASIFLGGDNTEGQITWTRPHTILVLGKIGEGHIAPELTDTIMLARINPLESPPKVKLISIPRDLLVKIDDPNSGELVSRINALWFYAQSRKSGTIPHAKKTFEQITGLAIDSVVVFDLETARKIIEKTDGVTVFVAEDIYDPRFPAEGGGYETFELKRGWRYLAAAEAMRFARTRASPRGDFDRIAHQQELLRALKGKIASLNPIWNFGKLWSIFELVKDEVVTDLTADDLKNLWALGGRVAFDDVKTMSIDERSAGITPKRISLGGQEADVLVASNKDMFDYLRVREVIAKFISE